MKTNLTDFVSHAPQHAGTACVPDSPRYDGYRGIHKALRLLMSDTLTRVGRADADDDEDVRGTLEQVGDLLRMCELHLHHENEFIHPALERVQPGSSARVEREHQQHLEAIREIRELAVLADHPRAAQRAAALSRLYLAMALFVAENFEHMHVEETEHNAILWAHYSDADLMEIDRNLVASIPPQTMHKALHWFMPALNAAERAQMLRGMQAGMPPAVFRGVLDIAERTIPASDFTKLTLALGVPMVRGAELPVMQH
jgi:Hemerythrin HHE cation binding domain